MKITVKPPKVHWRLYCTRKVVALGTLVLITYYTEAWTHSYIISKTHELVLGTLFEHLFFGIPFHE